MKGQFQFDDRIYRSARRLRCALGERMSARLEFERCRASQQGFRFFTVCSFSARRAGIFVKHQRRCETQRTSRAFARPDKKPRSRPSDSRIERLYVDRARSFADCGHELREAARRKNHGQLPFRAKAPKGAIDPRLQRHALVPRRTAAAIRGLQPFIRREKRRIRHHVIEAHPLESGRRICDASQNKGEWLPGGLRIPSRQIGIFRQDLQPDDRKIRNASAQAKNRDADAASELQYRLPGLGRHGSGEHHGIEPCPIAAPRLESPHGPAEKGIESEFARLERGLRILEPRFHCPEAPGERGSDLCLPPSSAEAELRWILRARSCGRPARTGLYLRLQAALSRMRLWLDRWFAAIPSFPSPNSRSRLLSRMADCRPRA